MPEILEYELSINTNKLKSQMASAGQEMDKFKSKVDAAAEAIDKGIPLRNDQQNSYEGAFAQDNEAFSVATQMQTNFAELRSVFNGLTKSSPEFTKVLTEPFREMRSLTQDVLDIMREVRKDDTGKVSDAMVNKMDYTQSRLKLLTADLNAYKEAAASLTPESKRIWDNAELRQSLQRDAASYVRSQRDEKKYNLDSLISGSIGHSAFGENLRVLGVSDTKQQKALSKLAILSGTLRTDRMQQYSTGANRGIQQAGYIFERVPGAFSEAFVAGGQTPKGYERKVSQLGAAQQALNRKETYRALREAVDNGNYRAFTFARDAGLIKTNGGKNLAYSDGSKMLWLDEDRITDAQLDYVQALAVQEGKRALQGMPMYGKSIRNHSDLKSLLEKDNKGFEEAYEVMALDKRDAINPYLHYRNTALAQAREARKQNWYSGSLTSNIPKLKVQDLIQIPQFALSSTGEAFANVNDKTRSKVYEALNYNFLKDPTKGLTASDKDEWITMRRNPILDALMGLHPNRKFVNRSYGYGFDNNDNAIQGAPIVAQLLLDDIFQEKNGEIQFDENNEAVKSNAMFTLSNGSKVKKSDLYDLLATRATDKNGKMKSVKLYMPKDQNGNQQDPIDYSMLSMNATGGRLRFIMAQTKDIEELNRQDDEAGLLRRTQFFNEMAFDQDGKLRLIGDNGELLGNSASDLKALAKYQDAMRKMLSDSLPIEEIGGKTPRVASVNFQAYYDALDEAKAKQRNSWSDIEKKVVNFDGGVYHMPSVSGRDFQARMGMAKFYSMHGDFQKFFRESGGAFQDSDKKWHMFLPGNGVADAEDYKAYLDYMRQFTSGYRDTTNQDTDRVDREIIYDWNKKLTGHQYSDGRKDNVTDFNSFRNWLNAKFIDVMDPSIEMLASGDTVNKSYLKGAKISLAKYEKAFAGRKYNSILNPDLDIEDTNWKSLSAAARAKKAEQTFVTLTPTEQMEYLAMNTDPSRGFGLHAMKEDRNYLSRDKDFLNPSASSVLAVTPEMVKMSLKNYETELAALNNPSEIKKRLFSGRDSLSSLVNLNPQAMFTNKAVRSRIEEYRNTLQEGIAKGSLLLPGFQEGMAAKASMYDALGGFSKDLLGTEQLNGLAEDLKLQENEIYAKTLSKSVDFLATRAPYAWGSSFHAKNVRNAIYSQEEKDRKARLENALKHYETDSSSAIFNVADFYKLNTGDFDGDLAFLFDGNSEQYGDYIRKTEEHNKRVNRVMQELYEKQAVQKRIQEREKKDQKYDTGITGLVGRHLRGGNIMGSSYLVGQAARTMNLSDEALANIQAQANIMYMYGTDQAKNVEAVKIDTNGAYTEALGEGKTGDRLDKALLEAQEYYKQYDNDLEKFKKIDILKFRNPTYFDPIGVHMLDAARIARQFDPNSMSSLSNAFDNYLSQFADQPEAVRQAYEWVAGIDKARLTGDWQILSGNKLSEADPIIKNLDMLITKTESEFNGASVSQKSSIQEKLDQYKEVKKLFEKRVGDENKYGITSSTKDLMWGLSNGIGGQFISDEDFDSFVSTRTRKEAEQIYQQRLRAGELLPSEIRSDEDSLKISDYNQLRRAVARNATSWNWSTASEFMSPGEEIVHPTVVKDLTKSLKGQVGTNSEERFLPGDESAQAKHYLKQTVRQIFTGENNTEPDALIGSLGHEFLDDYAIGRSLYVEHNPGSINTTDADKYAREYARSNMVKKLHAMYQETDTADTKGWNEKRSVAGVQFDLTGALRNDPIEGLNPSNFVLKPMPNTKQDGVKEWGESFQRANARMKEIASGSLESVIDNFLQPLFDYNPNDPNSFSRVAFAEGSFYNAQGKKINDKYTKGIPVTLTPEENKGMTRLYDNGKTVEERDTTFRFTPDVIIRSEKDPNKFEIVDYKSSYRSGEKGRIQTEFYAHMLERLGQEAHKENADPNLDIFKQFWDNENQTSNIIGTDILTLFNTKNRAGNAIVGPRLNYSAYTTERGQKAYDLISDAWNNMSIAMRKGFLDQLKPEELKAEEIKIGKNRSFDPNRPLWEQLQGYNPANFSKIVDYVMENSPQVATTASVRGAIKDETAVGNIINAIYNPNAAVVDKAYLVQKLKDEQDRFNQAQNLAFKTSDTRFRNKDQYTRTIEDLEKLYDQNEIDLIEEYAKRSDLMPDVAMMISDTASNISSRPDVINRIRQNAIRNIGSDLVNLKRNTDNILGSKEDLYSVFMGSRSGIERLISQNNLLKQDEYFIKGATDETGWKTTEDLVLGQDIVNKRKAIDEANKRRTKIEEENKKILAHNEPYEKRLAQIDADLQSGKLTIEEANEQKRSIQGHIRKTVDVNSIVVPEYSEEEKNLINPQRIASTISGAKTAQEQYNKNLATISLLEMESTENIGKLAQTRTNGLLSSADQMLYGKNAFATRSDLSRMISSNKLSEYAQGRQSLIDTESSIAKMLDSRVVKDGVSVFEIDTDSPVRAGLLKFQAQLQDKINEITERMTTVDDEAADEIYKNEKTKERQAILSSIQRAENLSGVKNTYSERLADIMKAEDKGREITEKIDTIKRQFSDKYFDTFNGSTDADRESFYKNQEAKEKDRIQKQRDENNAKLSSKAITSREKIELDRELNRAEAEVNDGTFRKRLSGQISVDQTEVNQEIQRLEAEKKYYNDYARIQNIRSRQQSSSEVFNSLLQSEIAGSEQGRVLTQDRVDSIVKQEKLQTASQRLLVNNFISDALKNRDISDEVGRSILFQSYVPDNTSLDQIASRAKIGSQMSDADNKEFFRQISVRQQVRDRQNEILGNLALARSAFESGFIDEQQFNDVKNSYSTQLKDTVDGTYAKYIEQNIHDMDRYQQAQLNYSNQIADNRRSQELDQMRYANEDFYRQQQNRYRRDFVSRATQPLNERRIQLQRQVGYDENGIHHTGTYERQIENLTTAQNLAKIAKDNYKGTDTATFEKLNANYANATKELEHMKAKAAEAQSELNNLNKAGTTGSAVFQSFGNTVGMIATRFGRQLFNKALAETKKFVQEFDKSMTQIQMITLKTDDQISELGKGLIDKALGTGSSVTEVTSAASDLYRQGLSDEDVNERLDDVLKFSKVAGIKTTEASKIITTALQNDLVGSSTEAMDALVALGDSAATTASEIAKGMQKSAASAKQAGMSYGELVTLLTIGTSKTQLGGSSLGSSLNTLIYRLYKVNKKEDFVDENGNHVAATDATKALKRMGVSLFDQEGNFRGPYQILQDIAAGWEDADDVTQSAILTTLGAGRQRSNVATLLQGLAADNGEIAGRYLQTAENSQGITDRKYDNYLDSLEAKINNVRTSWDQLIESFNLGRYDFIANFIQGLTEINKATGGLITLIPALSVAITALSAAFAASPLGKTIIIASGVVALAGAIGKVIQDTKPENIQKRQYEESVERYNTFTNNSKERSENQQKLIDDTKRLGEERDKAIKEGKEFDSTDAGLQLKSNLEELISIFPALNAEFANSTNILERWADVVKGASDQAANFKDKTIEQAEVLAKPIYKNIRETLNTDIEEINNKYQPLEKAEQLIKEKHDNALTNARSVEALPWGTNGRFSGSINPEQMGDIIGGLVPIVQKLGIEGDPRQAIVSWLTNGSASGNFDSYNFAEHADELISNNVVEASDVFEFEQLDDPSQILQNALNKSRTRNKLIRHDFSKNPKNNPFNMFLQAAIDQDITSLVSPEMRQIASDLGYEQALNPLYEQYDALNSFLSEGIDPSYYSIGLGEQGGLTATYQGSIFSKPLNGPILDNRLKSYYQQHPEAVGQNFLLDEFTSTLLEDIQRNQFAEYHVNTQALERAKNTEAAKILQKAIGEGFINPDQGVNPDELLSIYAILASKKNETGDAWLQIGEDFFDFENLGTESKKYEDLLRFMYDQGQFSNTVPSHYENADKFIEGFRQGFGGLKNVEGFDYQSELTQMSTQLYDVLTNEDNWTLKSYTAEKNKKLRERYNAALDDIFENTPMAYFASGFDNIASNAVKNVLFERHGTEDLSWISEQGLEEEIASLIQEWSQNRTKFEREHGNVSDMPYQFEGIGYRTEEEAIENIQRNAEAEYRSLPEEIRNRINISDYAQSRVDAFRSQNNVDFFGTVSGAANLAGSKETYANRVFEQISEAGVSNLEELITAVNNNTVKDWKSLMDTAPALAVELEKLTESYQDENGQTQYRLKAEYANSQLAFNDVLGLIAGTSSEYGNAAPYVTRLDVAAKAEQARNIYANGNKGNTLYTDEYKTVVGDEFLRKRASTATLSGLDEAYENAVLANYGNGIQGLTDLQKFSGLTQILNAINGGTLSALRAGTTETAFNAYTQGIDQNWLAAATAIDTANITTAEGQRVTMENLGTLDADKDAEAIKAVTEAIKQYYDSVKDAVNATEDVDEAIANMGSSAGKNNKAIDGIGKIVSGLKKGGIDASQGIAKLRSSMNSLQDQATALQKAQNKDGTFKSGKQIDKDTRDILAGLLGTSADDLKKKTADEMQELLEPLQDNEYFNEIYSDTLQSMFDNMKIANPVIDMGAVKAVVNGEMNLEDFRAACGNAAADIMAQIMAMATNYGNIVLETDENGNVIGINGVFEPGKGYHSGGGGGGGGKSATDTLIENWGHKVTAQQHAVTMAEIQTQDAATRNDGDAYLQGVDQQIAENEKLRQVYEDQIAAYKAQLATLKEGTEDWYKLRDAIYSAEEAQAKLNQTIMDLESSKINEIIEAYEHLQKLSAHEMTSAELGTRMAKQDADYDSWRQSLQSRVNVRLQQGIDAENTRMKLQQEYDEYLQGEGHSENDEYALKTIEQINQLIEIIESTGADIRDILNEELDVTRQQRENDLQTPEFYSSMLGHIINQLDYEGDTTGQLAAIDVQKDVGKDRIAVYEASNEDLQQQLEDEYNEHGYSQHYFEILKEIQSNLLAIAGIEQEIRELEMSKKDVISEFFNNILDDNTHEGNILKTQQGLYDYYNDYDARRENVQDQRQNIKDRRKTLQQELNTLTKQQSQYKKGDKNWNAYQKDINRIIEEIYGLGDEENNLNFEEFNILQEEYDNKLKPYKHASEMYKIESESLSRKNDYEGMNENIENQISINNSQINVYNELYEKMKTLRDSVDEGSDAWWKYNDAMMAADESAKKLENDNAKLAGQKLGVLIKKQTNEDKEDNHAYDMFGLIGERAMLEDDFATYEKANLGQQATLQSEIDQNNEQVQELEALLAEYEIGSEDWLKTRDEIWKIKTDTAKKENEQIKLEKQLTEQRLAQITKNLTNANAYSSHDMKMMQSYGSLYQMQGNYTGYRATIDQQLADWEVNTRNIEIAREATLKEMSELDIGSPEWIKARDAVYSYDEALAQAAVTTEQLKQASDMSFLQEIQKKFDDTAGVIGLALTTAGLNKQEALRRKDIKSYQQYTDEEKLQLEARIQARKNYIEEQKKIALDETKTEEAREAARNNILKAESENANDQWALDHADADVAKTRVDLLMNDISWQDNNTSHNLNIVRSMQSEYQSNGELTNYGIMLDKEADIISNDILARQARIQTLELEKEAVKDDAESVDRLNQQIMQEEEGIAADNAALAENTKKREENEKAILQTQVTLQHMVADQIKTDIENQKKMLSAQVSLQKSILEVIKQRYKDQWDLEKKDIQKQKEALQEYKNNLNERLNARKDAINAEEKYRQLEEYERQLALISADPTRTKEQKELSKKINDLRRDISMDESTQAVQAESETIDEQIKSLDDYVSVHEEDLNSFLENDRNFADEVNEVMNGSKEDMLNWFKENSTAFQNATDEAQQQMLQGWEETWKQMKGIVETYWKEIADIMSSEDSFVAFMKNTPEFKNLSQEEQAVKEQEYREGYRIWKSAGKRSVEAENYQPDKHEQAENEGPAYQYTATPVVAPEKQQSDVTPPETPDYNIGNEEPDNKHSGSNIETEDDYHGTGKPKTDTGSEDPDKQTDPYTPGPAKAPEGAKTPPSADDTGTGDFKFPDDDDKKKVQQGVHSYDPDHKKEPEKKKYKITWEANGKKVSEGVYAKNMIPSFNGDTPTKPSTDEYDYKFKKWSPDITPVTKDQTYKAKFKQIKKNSEPEDQPTTPESPSTPGDSGSPSKPSGSSNTGRLWKYYFEDRNYNPSRKYESDFIYETDDAARTAGQDKKDNLVNSNYHNQPDKIAKLDAVTVRQKPIKIQEKPKKYSMYKNGGLVDYTGPAWVDGTKTKPEAFLDAIDTELIRALVGELKDQKGSKDYQKLIQLLQNQQSSPFEDEMFKYLQTAQEARQTMIETLNTFNNISLERMILPQPEMYNNSNTSYGDINITINQAELKTDEDYATVARKVGKAFTKELSKRGYNVDYYRS